MIKPFQELFKTSKPVIGCIHLLPLPGSPLYSGNMKDIFDRALRETELYQELGVHGLIVENFGDIPFYPDGVPVETTAAMTAIVRDLVRYSSLPIGVNVLRNDGCAAMAIATVAGAAFIRVNVHMGAMVTDQGLVQGMAHQTTRLRTALRSHVAILADVAVKHAAPLARRPLELEVLDLVERGCVDGVIVSGDRTGGAVAIDELIEASKHSRHPVYIGSGTTPDSLPELYPVADGFIVGSYFKHQGDPLRTVNADRVLTMMKTWQSLQ